MFFLALLLGFFLWWYFQVVLIRSFIGERRMEFICYNRSMFISLPLLPWFLLDVAFPNSNSSNESPCCISFLLSIPFFYVIDSFLGLHVWSMFCSPTPQSVNMASSYYSGRFASCRFFFGQLKLELEFLLFILLWTEYCIGP